MTRGMRKTIGIALSVGFVVSAAGLYAQASQQWTRGACPPGDPFSYCLVYEGSGTWTFLAQSWTALGILVHPGLIEIRDPYTGHIAGRIHAPGTRRFTGLPAFSPDGRLLVTPVEDGAVVWEVESGRELRTLPGRGSAAFGPDGKVLAYLGPEGEVVVSDMETGREILALREFQPYERVGIIGFSPDGQWLVAAIPCGVSMGSGQQITMASVVWDMTTGHVARVFPGLVGFLPDGQLLVRDSAGVLPILKLWDGPRGAQPRVLRLPLQARVLGVSPDGRYFALGRADGTILFWELGAEQEVALLDLKAALEVGPEVEFRVAEVSFSPDGEHLLTVVWTPSVGKLQIHLWHVGSLLR